MQRHERSLCPGETQGSWNAGEEGNRPGCKSEVFSARGLGRKQSLVSHTWASGGPWANEGGISAGR